MSNEHGDGSVVVRRWLPTDPAVRGSESLFVAESAGQGFRPGRHMLYVGAEPAGERVAGYLRIDPGARVIARRKLLTADAVPVRIATSYFRADLFDGTRIAEPGFVGPSLQAALADLGHRFGHAEEELSVRPARSDEAEALRLPSAEWVVEVIRASYSDRDLPIHVLETICAGSRHVFPIRQAVGADVF